MKSFAFCGIGKVGGQQDGRMAGEESAALTTATIHSSLSMVPLDRAHSLGFCAEDEGREEGTGRETSEDAVGVLQNFYDMDAHRPRSAII